MAYEPANRLQAATADAAHWKAFMTAENERKGEDNNNLIQIAVCLRKNEKKPERKDYMATGS